MRSQLEKELRKDGLHQSKTPSFNGLQPSSEASSRAKRANRKQDSRHEILLRSELTKLGLRYRKYASDLLGNPDLVFRTAKIVVFCDGDFWHGRDWVKLKRKLLRRHNANYWIAKIASNREGLVNGTSPGTGPGPLQLLKHARSQDAR
jgi:DNA mismatch endonuclease Vsr